MTRETCYLCTLKNGRIEEVAEVTPKHLREHHREYGINSRKRYLRIKSDFDELLQHHAPGMSILSLLSDPRQEDGQKRKVRLGFIEGLATGLGGNAIYDLLDGDDGKQMAEKLAPLLADQIEEKRNRNQRDPSAEKPPPSRNDQVEFLPVYGYDQNVLDFEVNFWIGVHKNANLLTKLAAVAEKLSRFLFNGLPIQVLDIKPYSVEGGRIAVVELKEHKQDAGGHRDTTWCHHYFQGSTGGAGTQHTLKETFLQREYPGEWVDGVTFRYEGAL